MNCKPGEIATFRTEENRGRLVRIIGPVCNARLYAIFAAGQWWDCEALTHVRRFNSSSDIEMEPWKPGEVCQAPDSQLRPLRDPGEDAQDETLAWKPLPLPTLVEV